MYLELGGSRVIIAAPHASWICPKTCKRMSGSQASTSHCSPSRFDVLRGARELRGGSEDGCAARLPCRLGLKRVEEDSGAKSRAANAGHPADLPLRVASNTPCGGPCVILRRLASVGKLCWIREQGTYNICVSRGMRLLTAVKHVRIE